MASSHQSAREYIRDACENLLGRLQNLPLIVEKLHQQNVLNGNEVGDLEDEPENCRKTRKILDWVINKGEEACYKFLRILDRERKSVLPKPDSSSLTPDLHTWICLFSFRDEPEDDYTQGPISCHQLQKILKTRTKESLGEQWRQSQQFYGGKVQENFTFIPLVLDTDTEKNTPHNKIIFKSKKCKKSRSKKMRAYIPRDTQRKSPEDLLNSEEKSILIVGKPGIGKTTVVQQMLHHWAERHDPNLDFMFYFDENTLSNTSTTVGLEYLLLSKVLMSNPQLKDNAEEILHYLQEYSERVTIVFDGIRDFPDNAFLLGIMKHDLLPEAKVVATCRPEVEYEFSDWTTCKVYVQGFSEESINDFFRKMSGNDPEMVDSVINNPALFSLCHVPMYAFMVAACILNYTSEEAQKQCTASELYVRIFCQCLQRHRKNNLLHLDGHIKNCRDMILSLAESAFNATKLKTINLEFDYDEKDIAGAFLKTVSVVSPARAKTFCAFPHNTMQEFFSALWLLEKTEILDEVLHLCQNEDSKHMKHVIPFLCGLQSHTNIDHLKCLFPLNKVMENIDSFFEKVLNTFLCDQPDDEKVDVAFICQCLYEYQSPETCCSFLERINYYLDLSEEHLDPYTCCAVSYVISQSRNKQVHLDLKNSTVSLSGLKTVLDHSQYLRDLSATLCQVWTTALKCKELNYLIHLLQLCGNEIHIPVSQTDVLRQAGKIVTQYAEQTNLHLHCDKDPRQFSDLLCSTVFTWLPHISSLQFDSKQGEKEREERCRTFLLDLCLQAALHQPHNILQTVEKVMTFYYKEQSDFLLDLYSRVKQYESETGRRVLPALLPVYQSGPAVWSINLSERKVSLLLEVLKLQTEKKPVELRDCSDEESEVRSFLQCLPHISHLSFNEFDLDSESTASIQLLLNLSIAAVDCKSDKGESFTELLASVCSYNTFPFGEEYDGFQEEQSDFLLDLYSRVKQYESETGRRVLPALLPVYQSVPAVWYIKLSERKVSLLLEVLKLQTEKKPVELRDWSDEESEVRSFLQCLPYISDLRCGENIIPRLSKAVVDYAEDTKLVRAFFGALDFIFVIDWVLTTRECRAVRKVLRLSDSKLKLTLKPRAISLRGARFLFRHITHLQKLCLSDRVVGRMVRAFGAVRAGGSLVIEELCLSLNSINPKKEIFTFLSSLSSLLNIWTVHCVNLTECRMEAHSLISLMCHPGNLKIRLSKETLQQFTSLLCEVQDGELTRFFLEKVGGDLTSCSLSWEELIHFLQQRVCRISANIRKSKITYNHARQILPLLSEIQFKRLNPSVVLSIIREIYETGSAHCVSSLLSSTHSCINLNNTELDSYHCTALCFTLQHCTSVSLSLLWTSIPEGELVKILPLFNRVSQLSVDRVLLLKLLHCCSISELQQGAVAAVFSALQNRLDFSCSTGLDLSTETQDNTLHLTTEDCSDISTAIQKSLQLTELNLKDCEMEDTGVDMFFLILHTVKLCCSKTLLLRFLARLQVVNELDCVRHAMYLSQALDGEMDLSETPLDLPACRSLALFLEFSEGLSELDLSHCQLADHSLELLFPYLHKAAVLDLSHNGIDDCLAGRIYTVVSTSSNIQTVRLFNNRITDIEPFRKDKRFEVW